MAVAGDLPSRLRAEARELLKRATALVDQTISDDVLINELTNRVCRFYRVDRACLLSPSRVERVATARHVLMYLLRKEALLSFPEIGHLTQRNHSTVISGVRKTERRMDEMPAFGAMVEKLREWRK